jgi:pimeloyl-ACP methyl ester carboxylesterase
MEAAAYVARAGAARVSRLALLAPALPFLLKTGDNPGGLDRSAFDDTFAYWRKDYADWLVSGPSRLELFYGLGTFPISEGLVEWTANMMRTTSSIQVQLKCGATQATTDLRSDLKRIEIPTLIIHGDADASIPVSFGRATSKLIPGSRYVEYAGAPHGLFLTHRAQLLADLCDWMRAERS